MLFKNKTDKRSKEQIDYENLVFGNFEQIKQKDTFLDNNTFINQVLLKLNINKKDPVWSNLITNANQFIDAKNEVVFRDFVISFERDTRFSLYALVPTLTKTPNPKLLSLDLVRSDKPEENVILVQFNNLIMELLNKGLAVEILPEIIISYDNLIDKFTILFGKKFIKDNAH